MSYTSDPERPGSGGPIPSSGAFRIKYGARLIVLKLPRSYTGVKQTATSIISFAQNVVPCIDARPTDVLVGDIFHFLGAFFRRERSGYSHYWGPVGNLSIAEWANLSPTRLEVDSINEILVTLYQ